MIFRQNDNWDFHHHLVLFLFQGGILKSSRKANVISKDGTSWQSNPVLEYAVQTEIIYYLQTDNLFQDDSDAWEFGASRQTHVEAGLASPAKYAKTKGGVS